MSPITDPSEEYFKDGLWGWVVNQWKKLIADAAGHLQVDVVTSGLPAGGATAANQATMITALQLIDDLTNALNSIATDELDVVFDGQNLDVEVTQTTPADLLTGIHGWDGSAWRKLPLVFGYSDRWAEFKPGVAAGAGDAIATSDEVAAGYIYVLQALHANHNAGADKHMQVQLASDGITVSLIAEYTAATGTHYPWAGSVVMKAGDTIVASAFAPGDGKSVFLTMWGYKMRIAE